MCGWKPRTAHSHLPLTNPPLLEILQILQILLISLDFARRSITTFGGLPFICPRSPPAPRISKSLAANKTLILEILQILQILLPFFVVRETMGSDSHTVHHLHHRASNKRYRQIIINPKREELHDGGDERTANAEKWMKSTCIC